MKIDLPWPAPLLWPNGPRPRNHGHMAAVTAKHRQWAHWATLDALPAYYLPGAWAGGDIPVTIVVHAKAKGPLPDKDNCIAACKALLDGVADGLGVNDRLFGTPQVEFSPVRDGRIVLLVGDRSGDKFLPIGALNPLEKGDPDASANSSSGPDHNAVEVRND